jgi:hypothetical protein
LAALPFLQHNRGAKTAPLSLFFGGVNMEATRTVEAERVYVITSLKATAQDIVLNGVPCMISNTGSHPMYINPATTATAQNGFLIPAGTMLPVKFTVSPNVNSGKLSVISTTDGTSCAVIYFDM